MKFRRSQDFYIVSLIELNCNDSTSIQTQWIPYIFFIIMQAVILVDPDSSIEVEKERQEHTQFTHYKQ